MSLSLLLYWLSRILLGVVFIFAAVGKIINPAAFSDSIDNYQLLPYFGIAMTAVVLPWIEIVIGALFIIGKWLRGASAISVALNIIFIFAIASAMARGLDIDCGCFSVAASKVGMMRLIEDVILLAMSVHVFRVSLREQQK